MSQENYILLSQLPKQLWLHLIDSQAKLEIDYIDYNYGEINIHAKIHYLDIIHSFRLLIYIEEHIHQKFARNVIDQIIKMIKNKVKCTIFIPYGEPGYLHRVNDFEYDIKIESSYFSFEFSDQIITFLEYAKKICYVKKNPEYIEKIYNIYMKYYPNSKMREIGDDWVDRSENYPNDLKRLFDCDMYYGHHEYDLDEYEIICQTGKYEKYFPICYCTEESKLYGYSKGYKGNTMMVLDWANSVRECLYEPTHLWIRYLALPKSGAEKMKIIEYELNFQ
jgi:hypothetical protein